MPTRGELKNNAKQALTGKWGKGALITLCFVLVVFGIGIATAILSFIPFIQLATLILEIPLSLGLIFSFIKLRRGEEVGPFDFCKMGFENFKKSWSIFGCTALKMIAPIIAMIVIMIIATIGGITAMFSLTDILKDSMVGTSGRKTIDWDGSYSYEFDGYDFDDISYTTNPYARGSREYGIEPYSSSSIDADLAVRGIGTAIGTIVLMGVLSIAMFGVSIWATCKGLLYALSYYIAYDNPEMTAKDAVQRSEDLMKGNRGKLFVLQISFVGWAMLACITFGIGYFWLIPYMMVTLVCFYESLAGNSNNNPNNMNYVNNTTNNAGNVNGIVNANSNVNNMNYTNNNANNMNYVNGNVNNMNYPNNNLNNMNGVNNIDYTNNNMTNQNITQQQNMNNFSQNMNQAPEVTEYVPANLEQGTNQYNPVEPVTPQVNQYNPVEPAIPQVNQYNPVEPAAPEINQYNPVEPVAPQVNQYNPVEPTAPDMNQYNPMNDNTNNNL